MLQNCIRILQVGDIHLPEWEKVYSHIDEKDKNYSPSIIADIRGLDNMTAVLQRLTQLGTSSQTDAVAFMGDFTTRGVTDKIPVAIEILSTLMTRFDGSRVPMFGVPGNHDVDKKEAILHGSQAKFSPLERAFQKFGWLSPPINRARKVEIESDDSSLSLSLINTSIGSWSAHLLPDILEAEFSEDKLLDVPLSQTTDNVGENSPEGDFLDSTQVGTRSDQLFAMDVPFISKGTTASLRKEFSENSDKDTHVIIGHHNILPQKIPRITPYGEMLNAGMFRRYLQNTGRNVVYLHGHIHDDPIEIIGSPPFEKGSQAYSMLDSGKIVSISAPPIWEGFNEVTFFLDEDSQVYLLRVTKYRLDENMEIGNYSDQETVYIPLLQSVSDLLGTSTRKVLQALKEQRSSSNPTGTIKWTDFLTYLNEKSVTSDSEEVERSVLKLFCGGLVRINNLGREPVRWALRLSEVEA